MHIWQAPTFEEPTIGGNTPARPASEADFKAGAIDPLYFGTDIAHEAGILNLRDQNPGYRAIPGLEYMSKMLNDDAAPEVRVLPFSPLLSG